MSLLFQLYVYLGQENPIYYIYNKSYTRLNNIEECQLYNIIVH